MSTDVHTLSGAYALDALAPEEAAEFRRHLDECQACREEVRELQRVVARMGAAEASAPPPGLRSRVLAAAERTPQEPPATNQAGTGSDTSWKPADVEGTRSPRWVTWIGAAAAAAVVVVAGAVGIRAVVDDDPALDEAVAAVFEAEDARTTTVETTNGGELTVAVSESNDEMAVDTRELPELDDEQVYQIWTVVGDEMVSAAILSETGSGAAMGLPEDAQVALTVEPSGGSTQPTSAPIVQVDPAELLES